jgi:putative ATP-grasp target RiPP
MATTERNALMTIEPASLRILDNDPLVTAAERVPLAWPRTGRAADAVTGAETGPRSATLPFGLRFAVEVAATAEALPPWRWCPGRQIAVGEEGQPWHRTLVDATMATTGPSPDGGGSTGGEEWTPDFMSDETG